MVGEMPQVYFETSFICYEKVSLNASFVGVEVTEAGSLPHHYTHTLPSDALEAVRACLLREVGTTDFASSLYAIVARGASLSQVSLQVFLLLVARFDMEDIYKLVQSAERSRLGTLYDVIESTRLVVENALSTRIQENLLLAKIKELEGQVNSLKQMCKRNGAATHETSGTIFAYENLKGHHVIKYGSPFKEAVLNDILRAYAPTNRVKHKTCLVITEFLRTVFKQICAPDPSDIWNYAHRTSNISLKQDLIDLPESLIITLTDFVLDALDLGWRDLQGHRLNALRSSRDSWWLSLGETDDERDKKFNSLLEKKSYWSTQTGLCISEALEDIRYYRLDEGKLVPSKKFKSVQRGFGREDKAQMSKQEWRRLALYMREPLRPQASC
ncbi:unnamed protein product [Cylicocyclus nassatus]|uniref:Uncharacterized protein n=1 Tax=Cylicocyclus nassatus TaxID=53992 RepID=A0AA36M897_CYLNA|nr:unnamed protein product [Cylicocyclus nassatus]